MAASDCAEDERDEKQNSCGCECGSQGARPEGERESFAQGFIDTPVGPAPKIDSRLKAADILGRWAMRWGIGRNRYQVAPGLYAIGNPDSESPVLVTANYKMTFDVLRRDIAGLDAWIAVLDTKGINVWCAAGKGTFGTDELVARIQKIGLDKVVSHRKIILPQLGAPGTAAHEVKKRTGFSVCYGPVRSSDIKAFLNNGMKASPEMRLVRFSFMDRLVLTPVELTNLFGKSALLIILLLFAISGFSTEGYSLRLALFRGLSALGACLLGVAAGAVAAPVLLPWLPWRAFSLKGCFVGLLSALGLILAAGSHIGHFELMALLFAVPAVASYCAMNFTGSTPFTSPSGVEKEMRKFLPYQMVAAGLAAAFWILSAFSAT